MCNEPDWIERCTMTHGRAEKITRRPEELVSSVSRNAAWLTMHEKPRCESQAGGWYGMNPYHRRQDATTRFRTLRRGEPGPCKVDHLGKMDRSLAGTVAVWQVSSGSYNNRIGSASQ